jgi:chromosome segregation ATPase
MANFSERIVKLEQRLNKINQRLIKVSEELQKNQNFSEIKAKEKELIELNQSLSTSQSEKEKILKDLNAEIAKVKNSNLSNEEKSKQIIALTTNNQQERTEIFNNLSQAW